MSVCGENGSVITYTTAMEIIMNYIDFLNMDKLSDSENVSSSVQLFFAGDVVLTQKLRVPLIRSDLKNQIQNCDVLCCNFEAPIACAGAKNEPKVGPSLTQCIETATTVRNADINLVTLANNHIMDIGPKGLGETLKVMRLLNISTIGAGMNQDDAFRPYIFEKNGFRIGILSVAENGYGTSIQKDIPGYAWFGAERFQRAKKALLEECTHVIIVCHGGAEKCEFPLPEYRNLYRGWIDEGVSAVIAHHPHVPQGWEQYREGLIFYSLGNFAFNKGLGIQDPETISVKLDILPSGGMRGIIIPTIYTDEGVGINNSSDFQKHMNDCCNMLGEGYLKRAEEFCVEAYQKKYRNYYESVVNLYTGSVKRWIKTIVYRWIKHQKFSELWLYHNLLIETHYWICRRALDSLQNGGGNNE